MTFSRLLILTALVILVPRQAVAQQDPHLRNDCRLASQVLRTGHPAPHRQWAWSVIPSCTDSAGPVLAAVWNSPAESELGQLWGASHSVGDARLSRAVMNVLRDPARTKAVRITAARVLATHAAPNLVLLESHLAMIVGDSIHGAYVSIDHSPLRRGAVPVTSDVVQEIRDTLDSVARQDSDPEVRKVVRAIAQQIEMHVGRSDRNGLGYKPPITAGGEAPAAVAHAE